MLLKDAGVRLTVTQHSGLTQRLELTSYCSALRIFQSASSQSPRDWTLVTIKNTVVGHKENLEYSSTFTSASKVKKPIALNNTNLPPNICLLINQYPGNDEVNDPWPPRPSSCSRRYRAPSVRPHRSESTTTMPGKAYSTVLGILLLSNVFVAALHVHVIPPPHTER